MYYFGKMQRASDRCNESPIRLLLQYGSYEEKQDRKAHEM